MSDPQQLSIEQEFAVRSLEEQVKEMSESQAKKFLLEIFRQHLLMENGYKRFIATQFGLVPETLQGRAKP